MLQEIFKNVGQRKNSVLKFSDFFCIWKMISALSQKYAQIARNGLKSIIPYIESHSK